MKSIEELLKDTSKIDLNKLNAKIEEHVQEINDKETELIALIALRGKILHDIEIQNKGDNK